jgi:hypothetical protein
MLETFEYKFSVRMFNKTTQQISTKLGLNSIVKIVPQISH